MNTLFGQDGVQTLDGEEHEHQKTMFMDLMTKDSLQEIADLVEEEWMKVLPEGEKVESIILYSEVKKILTLAICRWTGVPIDNQNIDKLSEQLGNMYESAEKSGLQHIKGKQSRKKVEIWIEELVDDIRSGKNITSEDTPLYKIATHRDLEGNLLAKHTATDEVLNLLRPTVAVSVYIALSGLALHDFP